MPSALYLREYFCVSSDLLKASFPDSQCYYGLSLLRFFGHCNRTLRGKRGKLNSCVSWIIFTWKSFHSYHSLVRAIVIGDIKRELLCFPATPLDYIRVGCQNSHSCHMVDRTMTLVHSTRGVRKPPIEIRLQVESLTHVCDLWPDSAMTWLSEMLVTEGVVWPLTLKGKLRVPQIFLSSLLSQF